ncbi:hypothetical protein Q6272_32375, partial [Klebsiella pneumoniae]|uniref:hypothetical protein n=1 Tax=Klebsiella pneumoniae TaxID=573 RepID=UPI002730FFC2
LYASRLFDVPLGTGMIKDYALTLGFDANRNNNFASAKKRPAAHRQRQRCRRTEGQAGRADFLELERAFHRHWVLRATAEE